MIPLKRSILHLPTDLMQSRKKATGKMKMEFEDEE